MCNTNDYNYYSVENCRSQYPCQKLYGGIRVIELKQVTKKYGGVSVLKNISLSIDEPGIYCLLGRNGAGKTTLLKSIAGYQNITAGKIEVNGKAISTATLDTGVSYIENFARHFNLPVRKLLKIASEVNPNFDFDFAYEMMGRFELDEKKRFNHLSLGMKTMVSTIICLASNKEVILLDEPVLGFDAIMRVEFYDMLTESFQKHPRVIIVSTHIIEEIAKTIQKLIIIDKGSVCFFDTLQTVETKAHSISGLQKDVDAATEQLHIIGRDAVGGLVTSYIFDVPPEPTSSLEIHPLSLQDFFIQMVGHKGGTAK
ncbi:ABC transporter ATP-binding protein [Clostridium botulinum]|nr:ABC transporter ATP-binding protein [Clostridium botulinum]NFS54585.1 ABC transporter ATP-binding protein [Clostridium botulinum]NFT17555.1 ABC transporter ATP-binding protein [Clostridium botulinum]